MLGLKKKKTIRNPKTTNQQTQECRETKATGETRRTGRSRGYLCTWGENTHRWNQCDTGESGAGKSEETHGREVRRQKNGKEFSSKTRKFGGINWSRINTSKMSLHSLGFLNRNQLSLRRTTVYKLCELQRQIQTDETCFKLEVVGVLARGLIDLTPPRHWLRQYWRVGGGEWGGW